MSLYLLRPLVCVSLRRCFAISSQSMQQACKKGGAGKVTDSLKRSQKIFQEKNDLPVFLKGGSNDRILYLTTLGLTGVGLLYTLVFLLSYLFD